MSIESASCPEEALWRQVLIHYAGEVFRIKVDVDKAKSKLQRAKTNIIDYKRSFEFHEFRLQKLRLELFPIEGADGSKKLPMYFICEYANVDFIKFRQEMLKIIDDERPLPEGSRLHLPKT